MEAKPVQFIYSNRGPDHRINYNISVKLALIALYHKLDLDYLCAVRTAPYHLYRNLDHVNCQHRFALAQRGMSQEMKRRWKNVTQ